MTDEARLNLNDLGSASIPGVSARLRAALAEAAGVCLESQEHAQGVDLRVSGYVSGVYSVDWHPIPDRSRRAWNDSDEATEYGAAGVAVLLIERETGYSVIQRSDKGTGVDYWLGDASDPKYRFAARLEVSGIRSGDSGRARARIRQKLNQTRASDSAYGNLPAYVVVVEFGFRSPRYARDERAVRISR